MDVELSLSAGKAYVGIDNRRNGVIEAEAPWHIGENIAEVHPLTGCYVSWSNLTVASASCDTNWSEISQHVYIVRKVDSTA